jgi:hypothetical protein
VRLRVVGFGGSGVEAGLLDNKRRRAGCALGLDRGLELYAMFSMQRRVKKEENALTGFFPLPLRFGGVPGLAFGAFADAFLRALICAALANALKCGRRFEGGWEGVVSNRHWHWMSSCDLPALRV